MHSFATLVKREWLEGRSVYVIAPAVVLTLIIVAAIWAAVLNPTIELDEEDLAEHGHQLENAEGVRLDGISGLTAMAFDIAGATDGELASKLDVLTIGLSQPFYITLMFVTFFAFIAAIHDERKDRSVLFWKSMPISDTASVLSKYVTIAWVAPIATIIGIWIAQLFALTYLSFFVEDGFGGRIWSFGNPISSLFHNVLGYAIQGLWALPVYAWLLLVSAWADRAPIFAALGIPAVVVLLERIFFDSSALLQFIGSHIRLRAVTHLGEDRLLSFGDQLSVLGHPSFWVGLVAGGAMIAATIYLRRRLNDI